MPMAAIGGIIGAVGSIAGAGMESSAAGKAAQTQAQAAEYGANLNAELGQESLGYENYQSQQNQANEAPFLQSGANSEATLDYLLGIGGQGGTIGGGPTIPGTSLSIPSLSGTGAPAQKTGLAGLLGGNTSSATGTAGVNPVNLSAIKPLTGTANTNLGAYGSLMQGYGGGQFQAPTAEQARQTPGYQFGLQQGEGALQAGAAANGTLLTGGMQNALGQYAQNYADTNYNNVYNQALQTYGTNYNTWSNQNANEYNRLASVAGLGQTTAQQLGTQGLTSAGQVANTLGNTGQQISTGMNNAAAATASGYVGSANAMAGGLSGAGNSLTQMMMMNSLLNGGGGGWGTGNGQTTYGTSGLIGDNGTGEGLLG